MDGVSMIGIRAFAACTSLTEVVFPDSVTSISGNLFDECYQIRHLTLPLSVNIGGLYFGGDPDSIESVVITGGTTITHSAFRLCCGLKQIILPDTITAVNSLAFDHCLALTELHLPDSVESLGIYAVSNCPEITSLVLPKNLTTIGQGAFENNVKMASMIIHNNVTSIDREAFRNCPALTDIYYTGTEEEWAAISVHESDNDALRSATIHYNYVPET